MSDADAVRNTSLLSQSYAQGLKRITSTQSTLDEELLISQEAYENRKKSWAWLFEKFSKISDDMELNILTLKPDDDSNNSYVSEVRIPLQKPKAQIQYWVDTGEPPCKVITTEEGDSNESFSISESEQADSDYEQSRSSFAASMIVNNKLANSTAQITATVSSASSVDTAAYILTNANATKKNEKDNRDASRRNLDNNIIARSINAAAPNVLLSKSMESPKTYEVSKNIPILHKSMDGNEERNTQSEAVASSKIVSDKSAHPFSRGLKTKNSEKATEGNFESQKSGIDSWPVEHTDEGVPEEAAVPPESSDNVAPILSQTSSRSKRKLFTKNDDIVDILIPVVETTVKSIKRKTFHRKSFHPALDSPSSVSSGHKKAKARPSLLTMPGGRVWPSISRNYSHYKRKKSKFSLSGSRALGHSSILHRDKKIAASSVETSVSHGDKNLNNSVNVNINHVERSDRVASDSKKSLPTTSSLNLDEKTTNEVSTNKSQTGDSSSLSSADVSQIINEELNENPQTPVNEAQKKNRPSDIPVDSIQKSDAKNIENDQGSIFKSAVDSSSETTQSRMQNMLNIKKNLCATDLRSSGDTESPLNSSLNASVDREEDNMSDASTILLCDSRRRTRGSKSFKADHTITFEKNSASFNPVVILHDFLQLKNCCGQSAIEINMHRLSKQNDGKCADKDERQNEKKTLENNSDETENPKNLETRKAPERESPKSKKSIPVFCEKESRASLSLDDNTQLLENKTTCLKIRNADNENLNSFVNESKNYSKEMESDSELVSEAQAKFKFTNTNSKQWESIFALTSSDDENSFKNLHIALKSRSSKMKNGEKVGETTSSNNNTRNANLKAFESTRTYNHCTIVFSSSEEETETVKKGSNSTGARGVAGKYFEHQRGKSSKKSGKERISMEDGCEDRSGGFKNNNAKLDARSTGVNRLPNKRKSKRISLRERRDFVPRSNLDSENLSEQNFHADRICGNSESGGSIVSSKSRIIDGENDATKMHENAKVRNLESDTRSKNNKGDKNSIARYQSSLEKSAKRKTRHNLSRSIESSESEDEPEIGRLPNYKRRRKVNSPTTTGERNNRKKNCTKFGELKFVSQDESSGTDDNATISDTKNYAGDNSRGDNRKDEDTGGEKIDSNVNSKSSIERRNHIKKDARSLSKRKIKNMRANTDIVFRTKEYWELDSDES